jgi:tetratricopeptide (TPR) repeat protein
MILAALLALGLAAGEPLMSTKVDGRTAATVVAASADQEASRWNRVQEANRLAHTGKAADALKMLDVLLAEYAKQYPPGATRWYVARNMPESMAYLVQATAQVEGSGHGDAQVLTNVAWADAYFVKGYALVELERFDQAREALEHALDLAPGSAEALIELGEIAKLQRRWDEAMADYTAAEDASTFSPEEMQQAIQAQAMRGQAFVLVEKGDYDAAEKILKACLRVNANDARAKEDLDYIRQARAAKKR